MSCNGQSFLLFWIKSAKGGIGVQRQQLILWYWLLLWKGFRWGFQNKGIAPSSEALPSLKVADTRLCLLCCPGEKMYACTFSYISSLSCFVLFITWGSQRRCRKALEISAYILEVSRNLRASSNQSTKQSPKPPVIIITLRFPKVSSHISWV